MMRNITVFLLVVLGTFMIDQSIKSWAMESVNGVEHALIMKGSCINLELFYNRGVAFSMLSFLGENLKWVQLLLILGIIVYIFYEGYLKQYAFAIGLIVGGAIGNLYDRFIHEGVVDYVAWHCGFNFAVFNYADVMIDLGVAIILLMSYLEYRKEKRLKA
jgi:signal peptidase II